MQRSFVRLPALLALSLTGSILDAGDASAERPRTGYVLVSPNRATVSADEPNIIYMNRHGGTFHGTYGSSWDEDSTQNRSSIFSGTKQIPEYPWGDASWNEVMDCMREIYAPFNVEITDVDPGNVAHIESVVAGSPRDIDEPNYVGGIAPFDCDKIPNAIVYSFPEIWGNDPRAICETAAQETAHAYGLDHEYLCADPMTYLFGCGEKSFQDVDAQCGEDSPRQCTCGLSRQNSVQLLRARLGDRQSAPPLVDILAPRDGATVGPAFNIDVEADSEIGISRAELWIDGEKRDEDTSFPYGFSAPDDLTQGEHQISVKVVDVGGLSSEASVSVDLQPPCGGDDDCGDGELCYDGACVPAPETPGGLGSPCEQGDECYSGLCANSGGEGRCTDLCDPAGEDTCPTGFYCATASGGQGVCWEGGGGGAGGGGGGGCRVDGSSPLPAPWAVFGLCALGLALVLRRRPRP